MRNFLTGERGKFQAVNKDLEWWQVKRLRKRGHRKFRLRAEGGYRKLRRKLA